MRVLITGATGLIGTEIVKQCHNKGIAVNYLTTNKSKISNTENYKGFYWNINANEIDTDCIKNVDVIIHLVGASISKRWTDKQKQAILDSRIKTTALLHDTLKNNIHTVSQIIAASAIGYYPDSLTKYYTEEDTEVNGSFLGEVVEKWEIAIDTFKNLNIKLSKIRIGIVFSSQGGAFPQLSKPVKYGVGAAMGTGKQWMSWIHIDDLINLFMFTLEHKLEGIYNGVAPNAATNEEVTKAIAKHVKRLLFLPNIPKFVMALALGEMHAILFQSQRVSAQKIEDAGFNFKYYNLNTALSQLLE
jgi:uncharacterized protein (TIGR01777 family)